jgi:hypothetical protein
MNSKCTKWKEEFQVILECKYAQKARFQVISSILGIQARHSEMSETRADLGVGFEWGSPTRNPYS